MNEKICQSQLNSPTYSRLVDRYHAESKQTVSEQTNYSLLLIQDSICLLTETQQTAVENEIYIAMNAITFG